MAWVRTLNLEKRRPAAHSSMNCKGYYYTTTSLHRWHACFLIYCMSPRVSHHLFKLLYIPPPLPLASQHWRSSAAVTIISSSLSLTFLRSSPYHHIISITELPSPLSLLSHHLYHWHSSAAVTIISSSLSLTFLRRSPYHHIISITELPTPLSLLSHHLYHWHSSAAVTIISSSLSLTFLCRGHYYLIISLLTLTITAP